MSIFRSIVSVCLLGSMAVFAAPPEVDLSAPAFVDDFDDYYEDAPNQTTLGAVYGMIAYRNKPWLGGGYWYFFKDTQGSSVTNSVGEEVVVGEERTMVVDNALHVNLSTSGSLNTYPYAGVGCNLTGSGNNTYIDLSGATAISMKVKGTGTVRMHLETKDIAEAGYDWGWYGKSITLTADWTPVNIPVASLLPEEYSDPDDLGWTWANGKTQVRKLAFQVKDGLDAELFVDDIQLVGMTWADFDFQVPVMYFRTTKQGSAFSVNKSSVSFNLAQPQKTTISLHDLMGNQVRTLFSGTAASKTIDLNSHTIPSGRYLVIMNAQNTNLVQPLVIMK